MIWALQIKANVKTFKYCLLIADEKVKYVAEESYDGVPREKIPWNPKIDYEKCVTCGKCVDFCHVGAITLPSEEETQKVIDKLKKEKA